MGNVDLHLTSAVVRRGGGGGGGGLTKRLDVRFLLFYSQKLRSLDTAGPHV